MEPTAAPAHARWRRVRLAMTAVFTSGTVAGLLALAGIVIVLDGGDRARAEHDEAERRLTVAMAIMYDDDGGIRLDELVTDDVAVGHPELYVMAPVGDRPLLAARQPRLEVDHAVLRRLADRVRPGDDDVRLDARDTSGRPVVLMGRPYEDDDRLLAVGIVVADPDAGAAEHRRLMLTVVAGVVALAGVIALAGHAVAGRVLRPVIENLAVQEAFVADAAHELRTPVTVIRTAAEAARCQAPGSAQELDRIVRHAVSLGDVLEALLTRSRLAAGVQPVRRERLRLDLLLEEVVADRLRDGVTVTAHPSVVEADPVLLSIALRNLVDNALRHGRLPGEPPRVTVRVDGARVTVSDAGPGVPPALRQGRFERYVTQGGAGLGLSIAATVAQVHGGRLTAADADGGGAAFTLELPA